MIVRFSGGRELQARLRAMGDTQHILRDVGVTATAEAKRLVPRRTGNLARTIRIKSVSPTHLDMTAGGAIAPGYAAAVEFGSRPHVIVPRRARVLAWGGPRTLGGRLRVIRGVRAGAEHFAMRVRHPGTRPHPYLVPGLREGVKRITGLLIDAWNRGA